MSTRVYVISTKAEGVIYVASNRKKTIALCENILTEKNFEDIKWLRQEFTDGMAEYKEKVVSYKRFVLYE